MPQTFPKRSQVVVRPDGSLEVSYLWDDLEPIFRAQTPFGEPLEPFVPAIDDFSAKTADQAYRSCRLCPLQCGWNRVASPHPRCGDSEFRIGSAGIVRGDEPPISGTLGSGAMLLGGCPMRCPSCHSVEMFTNGKPCTPLDFWNLAWSFAGRAHNLQLLSPTGHFPWLRARLIELKRGNYPLPIVFKSSGYERVEWLRAFEGLVDIYLPDLKYGPGSEWAKRAGTPDYFEVACEAIKEMHRQVGPLQQNGAGVGTRGLLVRHILAPLPEGEREAILDFVGALKLTSSQLPFVAIEG